MRSWVVFEGSIRSVLHRLKYRRNVALGHCLALPLADFARSTGWPVDVVVPIPLGEKRRRERGYNQVALVAQPLAALAHWQYAPAALKRSRETRSQVGLTAGERQENMHDAFRARQELVQEKAVLLMDDVATTGADRKSTRLNSSHRLTSRMPSSA
jgi:ComF family protein